MRVQAGNVPSVATLTVDARGVSRSGEAAGASKQSFSSGSTWSSGVSDGRLATRRRNMLFCIDDEEESPRRSAGSGASPRCLPPPPPPPPRGAHRESAEAAQQRRALQVQRVEDLVWELFRLHDLNHNGVLEELELIKLNEKIAMLHYGRDTDKNAVRSKFRHLFRAELDPDGRPVAFPKFRGYMIRVLDGIDRNKGAQEFILEQFVEEAKSGRLAFHCHSFQSTTDEPFRSMIEPFYT